MKKEKNETVWRRKKWNCMKKERMKNEEIKKNELIKRIRGGETV